MRSLVVLLAMTLLTPVAAAGEFAPRESKPVVIVETVPAAPVAKAKPKARTVAKRTWRPAAKKKPPKKTAVEKRPLP